MPQDDDAGRVLRIAQRTGHNVGRHSRRNDRRQKVAAAAGTVLVQDLTLAAPRQKVLELALVARSTGLRQQIIGHCNAHRHRFQARSLPVDLANQQLPDGRQFAENPANRMGRLLDFDMAAGLSPDIDENRTIDPTGANLSNITEFLFPNMAVSIIYHGFWPYGCC